MDFIVNLVALALQNNENNIDNDVSDEEEIDADIPPLVEADNQEVPVMEPPTENPEIPSLYPVAMVNFDKNVDGKAFPLPLVCKDTGKVVDEVKP